MRERILGVIGAGTCDDTIAREARAVGAGLARAGCTIVTGGLGGVMEAASRGANEAGGRVIGLLPGDDVAAANPFVHVAIATGIGEARNVIIANTAEAFIAVGGAYGTLSEIAFALKRGKRVVSLHSFSFDPRIEVVTDADAAVRAVLA